MQHVILARRAQFKRRLKRWLATLFVAQLTTRRRTIVTWQGDWQQHSTTKNSAPNALWSSDVCTCMWLQCRVVIPWHYFWYPVTCCDCTIGGCCTFCLPSSRVFHVRLGIYFLETQITVMFWCVIKLKRQVCASLDSQHTVSVPTCHYYKVSSRTLIVLKRLIAMVQVLLVIQVFCFIVIRFQQKHESIMTVFKNTPNKIAETMYNIY